MPLVFAPDEAFQFDWSENWARVGPRQMKLLVAHFKLSHSRAFMLRAYPLRTHEMLFDAHNHCLRALGGITERGIYDNMKTVVVKVGRGKQRKVNARFRAMVSHFLFEPHFCLVRRPNEKGHVEGLLGYARRNFLVPVPRVDHLETLNAEVEDKCHQDLERRLRGKTATKAELLEEERSALLEIPKHRFEARRIEQARADSLALVRFDRNSYSVPTAHAYRPVTVVGGINEVRLVVDNRLVAKHPRHWGKEHTEYNPVHYLALLERKPGALDFARPLEGWNLPGCFAVLRRRLENQLGPKGTREYIKVLRLLENVSLGQLDGAVRQTLAIGALSYDAVRVILQTRQEEPVGLFSLDGRPHLKLVNVEPPDLDAYRALVAGGAS